VNTVCVLAGNIITKIKQGVTNHCLKDVQNVVMQCRIYTLEQKTTREKRLGNKVDLNTVKIVILKNQMKQQG